MKFEIDRKVLVDSLKPLAAIINTRQHQAVMDNVHIVIKDNVLTMTTANDFSQLTRVVNLEGNNDDLHTTLPAKKLLSIADVASGVTIKIELGDDEKAIVKAGKSRFKLSGLPAEDYPINNEIKDGTEFSINSNKLKSMITQTAFCVATNDVRYYLTGLLIEIKAGQLAFVATDGHRMAVSKTRVENAKDMKFIVPLTSVLSLGRLLALNKNDNDVIITADDKQVFVNVNENVTMSSKLIDGNYPDWEMVIPTTSEIELPLVTQDFKQAITRASILSNEKYKGLSLKIEGNVLTLAGKNSRAENSEDILELTDVVGSIEIGLNGCYLKDAVNAITTPEMSISFVDLAVSCAIKEKNNSDVVFIIMPMKL